MITPNDGGPAFPLQIHASPNSEIQEGMTLRDYFAAKAMQGLLAAGDKWSWRDTDEEPAPVSVATTAYELADAMLNERAKNGGQ